MTWFLGFSWLPNLQFHQAPCAKATIAKCTYSYIVMCGIIPNSQIRLVVTRMRGVCLRLGCSIRINIISQIGDNIGTLLEFIWICSMFLPRQRNPEGCETGCGRADGCRLGDGVRGDLFRRPKEQSREEERHGSFRLHLDAVLTLVEGDDDIVTGLAQERRLDHVVLRGVIGRACCRLPLDGGIG